MSDSGQSSETLVSRIFRAEGPGSWRHILPEPYKADTDSYQGMTRRELVGKRGENTRFHLRYFEIAPGGFSTLERHHHEHAVVVTRGLGEVRIGCRILPLSCGDVVYIAPDDPHQFLNPAENGEPFGFLCVVDAERDRPRPFAGEMSCAICE